MRFIDNRFSVDPYFNLALEEYLFKHSDDEYLMLWQSHNSIIVGKHQNAYREINLDFVNDHNITIARRLSGGGAVYHDLGNLNFTYIKNGNQEKIIDFDQFVQPIIKALNLFGIETYQGKRNEIMLNGMKISGNAEHTFKNRVLHHGTLLFNADLSVLVNSLRINPFKYKDKAIKSVQSRVTNLSEHLPVPLEFDDFRTQLVMNLKEQNADLTDFALDPTQLKEVELLVKEKFSTWQWNFGYSPNYELVRNFEFEGQKVQLSLKVKKGIMVEIESSADLTLGDLIGKQHEQEVVFEYLKERNLEAISSFLF